MNDKSHLHWILLPLLCICGCDDIIRPAAKPTVVVPESAGFHARLADAPLPEPEPFLRVLHGREVHDLAEVTTALASKDTPATPSLDQVNLEVVNFNDMPLGRVAVMLTRMTGQNVVVSAEAKNRPASIYLKNVTARAAIEGICRLNGLWYREDPEMLRILTAEEYGKELVIRRDEQTRLYYLKNASAPAVADMIAALMPDQVEYLRPGNESSYGHVGTDGDDPLENSEAGSSGNNNSSSNTGRDDGYRTGQVSRSSYNYSLSDVANNYQKGVTAGRVEQLAAREDSRKKGEIGAGVLAETTGTRSPVTISVFMRNNCIGVRTVQESMHREIGRMIEALDTATRQVLLEVKVLRITLGNGDESLFSLAYAGSSRIPEVTTDSGSTYRSPFPNGIASNPDATADGVAYRSRASGSLLGGADIAGNTVSFTYLNNNITATLKLLKSDNRVRVVATPMLLCANNAPAEFFSGVTRMITTNYDYETRYGDNNQAVDIIRPVVEEREIGTKVRIKPSINTDGTVTLRFLLEIGSVNENGGSVYQVKDGAVVKLPIDTVDNEKVESIVVGKHSQAVVMGGLISESTVKTDEKVPGLGNIPVVRRLFGKFKDTQSRTETVIMIIPHIIAGASQGEPASSTLLKNNSVHPWLEEDAPDDQPQSDKVRANVP